MSLKIEYLNKEDLKPYANNAKLHPAEQVEQIKNSIREFGFNDPIAIWHDNEIIEGHGRLLAAMEMDDVKEVPVIRLDDLTDEQRRAYMLAHNKLTMNTDFDIDLLGVELDDIIDIDMSEYGFEIEMDNEHEKYERKALTDNFIIPPFSVLDTRQGYWQDRKAQWRNRIGDDGQARGDAQLFSDSLKSDKYQGNNTFRDTSILDPVLSEIMCKWFAPRTGAKMFDCFAGDTVFGYVSSYLGNDFIGIELRKEQVDFNNAATAGMSAKYICDDGRNILKHISQGTMDMFFSCPPYYDLEVYSDLENDASNQETYEDFYSILDTAFTESAKCLKDNRFAVVICSDVRNHKDGGYYDFSGDIKATFKRNGFILYNELILVGAVGTAAIRSKRYMKNRKVARTHQNVLVFYKGDTSEIKNEFPELEVQDESADMEF